MPEQTIRPGWWLYIVAGVTFVAGWALFAVILWTSLSGMSEDLQQVVVPGTAELNLAKPGKYTIFHEYQSAVGSRIYSSTREVSGLDCSVRAKVSGTPVAISRSTSNSTYSLGGRSGVSYLDFHIEHAGVYVLTAEYPGGQEGAETVLAVGQGIGLRIVGGVLGSLVAVFGCIGLSIALAVFTGVKRYKSGQRAQGQHAL